MSILIIESDSVFEKVQIDIAGAGAGVCAYLCFLISEYDQNGFVLFYCGMACLKQCW